jgi:uncharacterized protein GlcG (DUF336 family)
MGELVEGHDIGLELAQRIIAAARAEAERQGHLVSIVVADRAGNCRTGEMAEPSMPGNGDWGFAKTIGGRMIVFAGGVSVRQNGRQVGALGISGALSEQDEAMCLAALATVGLEG